MDLYNIQYIPMEVAADCEIIDIIKHDMFGFIEMEAFAGIRRYGNTHNT
jgi:hypothetical protein